MQKRFESGLANNGGPYHAEHMCKIHPSIIDIGKVGTPQFNFILF